MVSIRKTVIKWEAPPTRQPRTPAMDKWEGVAAELILKPDEWALIDVTTRAAAEHLVKIINQQKPPFVIPETDQGSWRFRGASHHDKDREAYKVYARYEDLREEWQR